MVKTLQAEFWVPVRLSYLHSFINSERPPELGLICFKGKSFCRSEVLDLVLLKFQIWCP